MTTTLPAYLYALSDSKKDYMDITEGKIYKITNKSYATEVKIGVTIITTKRCGLVRFGLF